MEGTQGLEVIQPAVGEVTLSDGRTITVRPVTMGQLPKFIAAVKPLLGVIGGLPQGAPELVMFAALAEHGEAVNQALAITTKLPLEELEELGPDDGLALVLAVFRVNRDLFQRRLLPMLAQALAPESPPA
jgi:hypothetical protein